MQLPKVENGRALAFQAVFVVAWITTDLVSVMAVETATPGYDDEAALLCAAFLSLALCLVATSVHYGSLTQGFVKVFHFRYWLPLIHVSILFALAMYCQLRAIAILHALLAKILGQLKLPLTVALSMPVLGRRYTFVQLQLLVTLVLGVLAFTTFKLERLQMEATPEDTGLEYSWLLGVVLMLVAVFCSVLGSLFAEKAYKSQGDVPFYNILAHFKIGECLMGLVIMFVDEHVHAHADDLVKPDHGERLLAFLSFDASTWFVVVALLVDGWATGLIVRHLSNVAKDVAKGASLVILYFISVVFLGDAVRLGKVALALLIAQAICSFSYVSALQQAEEKRIADAQPKDEEPRREASAASV